MHLVPLGFDLYEIAVGNSRVSWQEGFDVRRLPDFRGADYLLIQAPDGRTAIGQPLCVETQWFRRIISTELGMPDRWNYRDYPALPMIEDTVLGLRAG